jgi:hypothetical protein
MVVNRTDQAAVVTFDVPALEFETEVDALRAAGVELMTFEMDGVDWKDGVASMGGAIRGVWFTDPDGNVLNLSAGGL